MDDFEIEYDLLGWPENLIALAGRLGKTGLRAATVKQLVATARPAMMLGPVSVGEDDIPLGETKIGGRPDIAGNFVWPVRTPYPDAREMAEKEMEYGAGIMALAGIAPPWMTPDEAKKFITKTLRERDEMAASLEELRAESELELKELENDDSLTDEDRQAYRDMLDDTYDLGPMPTREEAEAAGRHAVMTAEALTSDFPLAFIAQIDFASLAAAPGFDSALPKTGRLYLFYDLIGLPDASNPASRSGFHAVYDDTENNELVRLDLPAPLAELKPLGMAALLPPMAVKARSALTTVTLEACDDLGITLSDEQMAEYDEWLLGEVGWPGQPERDRHQLGGWPRAIQGNMQAFSQFAANGVDASTLEDWSSKKAKALLADAAKWHLLFQLGPDDAQDAALPGSINFLIRDDDLAARRFDRIWAVYEQS